LQSLQMTQIQEKQLLKINCVYCLIQAEIKNFKGHI
jgi:hypothetical protein